MCICGCHPSPDCSSCEHAAELQVVELQWGNSSFSTTQTRGYIRLPALPLQTAASNAALQRADLQKHALEAMMEVRRETLQKAFGANPRTAPKSSAAAPGQLPTAGASAGGGGANTGIVTTRSSVPQRAAPTGPSAPGLSSSRSHHPAHHHQEADRGAASPGPAGEQEGGGSGNGDVWGMLALEEQIEELTKEVIDMQVGEPRG
jgi:hypothetical protein